MFYERIGEFFWFNMRRYAIEDAVHEIAAAGKDMDREKKFKALEKIFDCAVDIGDAIKQMPESQKNMTVREMLDIERFEEKINKVDPTAKDKT